MNARRGVAPSTPSPARIAVAVIAAIVLASYLSGYFFLWSIGRPPTTATPLTAVQYGLHYGHERSVRWHLAVSSGAAFGIVAAFGVLIALPRRRSLHGDARFASRQEIVQAGLLGNEGIVLGRLGSAYLMLAGQQGVALAAPPRSGKGVGVVIPNCLNWDGSLVCVDIKGENWAITAGYRARMGHRVFRFDPFSETGATVRWNPLGYVSEDVRLRINDLQRVAQMLYPDPPGVDPFWSASARSLFLGIALYLFETPSMPRTLGEILRQGMASDDEGFGKHWKRIVENRAKTNRPLSSQCVQALFDVIDLAPVTASSIRKTFTSRLDLWLNPMLDAATSANDFDFRDLRRSRMSIYVCVNPDDLHRLRPVMNLFFQQAIGLQTRELPEQNPELKHQVLVMLDEFTALGRIPIIAEAIAYLPGYNVRTVLVVQTPAQLREVYGKDGAETILKSLAARVVFAPKDFSDAREISDELGFTTVKSKSYSSPTFGAGGKNRSPTVNVSEQRRALLLPQEVKELGNDRAILFYEGLRPIACQKIRYFSDPNLKCRVLPPPTVAPLDWTVTPRGVPEDASGALDDQQRNGRGPEGTAADDSGSDTASRRPTEADVLDAHRLELADFSANFDDIQLPPNSGWTSEQVGRVVKDFYRTIDTEPADV